ncbi:Putative glycosyltransferase EpsE [Paenibacillus konkukensis]|uniref:Glycosyltransferase EpsE n=2 Tax=Paenibacillus konkukensis TaxID=2020716 RepID=A0ABY4RHR7_9BACL|nr:Putative glycosyltransferase EpsE [Paenibacillus konkukensis]
MNRVNGMVSVVVPCYNASAFIRSCLDGLLKQTYTQMEWILVDDASSDSTVDTINSWLHDYRSETERLARVVFLPLPSNVGTAGSYTIGMFLARGEFIAIHDCDDISHPERLEKQVQFLSEHPEFGLVGTNYIAFEDQNYHKTVIPQWLAYGSDIPQKYDEGLHCISNPTVMLRGSTFDRIGGHTRKIPGAEDFEFFAKCAAAGIQMDNLREPLYFYRLHPKQHSRLFYP